MSFTRTGRAQTYFVVVSVFVFVFVFVVVFAVVSSLSSSLSCLCLCYCFVFFAVFVVVFALSLYHFPSFKFNLCRKLKTNIGNHKNWTITTTTRTKTMPESRRRTNFNKRQSFVMKLQKLYLLILFMQRIKVYNWKRYLEKNDLFSRDLSVPCVKSNCFEMSTVRLLLINFYKTTNAFNCVNVCNCKLKSYQK